MAQEIVCPNCGTSFNAEDALSVHIEEKLKKEYQEKIRLSNEELSKKAKQVDEKNEELQKKQEELAEKTKNMNELFQERLNRSLKEELIKREIEIQQKIEEKNQAQLLALQQENQKKIEEVHELRKKEIEFLQQKQILEDEKSKMQLDIQKQLLEGRKAIEEEVGKRKAEENNLQIKEYQKQLEDQKHLIEEMKRKSEQGSMQMQGEVQELVIEEELKFLFPFDEIIEVGKGMRGADCIQIVNNQFGKAAGKIIYESKRTKTFSNEWIDKLKADQRHEGADLSVLITQVMPKELSHFGLFNGVWVCQYSEYKALAAVLRDGVVRVAQANSSQENKGDKMTHLYSFMTSPEFRHQIEAIVEGFSTLKMDLDKEKRAMNRIWKEREKQIEKVITSTIDMYASVKGIAGGAVESIKALELDSSFEDDSDDIEE